MANMDTTKTSEAGSPDWGGILSGALIGLIVGGAVALLVAPRSGEATRREIADAVDDLKGRAETAMDGLQDSAAELANRTKSGIDQTRDNLIRSLEAGKDAYQQRKDELIQQLES